MFGICFQFFEISGLTLRGDLKVLGNQIFGEQTLVSSKPATALIFAAHQLKLEFAIIKFSELIKLIKSFIDLSNFFDLFFINSDL